MIKRLSTWEKSYFPLCQNPTFWIIMIIKRITIMALKVLKTVRPDAKGRITLGHVADGVSSYRVIRGKHNAIILEPLVEVPAHEKWLFDNKHALQQVKKGLEDSAKGRVKERGSFSKYIDDEI